MKKSGYGTVAELDEYVVKVLVYGFKSFGEEALTEELQQHYKMSLAKLSSARINTLRI